MGDSKSSSLGTTTLSSRPKETDGQVDHLKLKKPKNNRKKVSWDPKTVDNEHLNKKSSKCCCIYTKPSCTGKKSTRQLQRPDGQKEEPKPKPDKDNY